MTAGADSTGKKDIVKKIIKGQMRVDDYDYIVCVTEMATDVAPLRGVLKKKFPTKLNGALGDDLRALVTRFRTGIQYKIEGDEVFPKYGISDTVIGDVSGRVRCAHAYAAVDDKRATY
jgi:large subunit ribosomal protein L1